MPHVFVRRAATALLVLTSFALSACGGGSSGNLFDEPNPTPSPAVSPSPDPLLVWQQGVFYERSSYKDRCENPRQGNDPFNNNRPYPDRQGSVAHEKLFLRSWTHELYLWYDEVPDEDPANFGLGDYFTRLKTPLLTNSGAAKDNFHFSQNTLEYNTRTNLGQSFGYGMDLLFPPGRVYVRDVLPDTPAAALGVTRGMHLIEVDGVDVALMTTNEQIDAVVAALFTDTEGETHSFVFRRLLDDSLLSGSMSSAVVQNESVKPGELITADNGPVGYLHFKSHDAPAERRLYEAFGEFAEAGVSDLVLDLRYNGGGFLAMAAQVAYMIAGAEPTAGQAFYRTTFNDKHPDVDPISGAPLQAIPFVDESLGFRSQDLAAGLRLPSLNLTRVYVITSSGTCSASEAIINGLRGVGLEVVLIGATTCGKPYGFYPQDNCGTTYFSIQFTGVNAVGFGEYSSGFSPLPEPGAVGVPMAGCYVEDDLTRLLGDPEEAMLAAALHYRVNGSCPEAVAEFAAQQQKTGPSDLKQVVPPAQPGVENAILRF